MTKTLLYLIDDLSIYSSLLLNCTYTGMDMWISKKHKQNMQNVDFQSSINTPSQTFSSVMEVPIKLYFVDTIKRRGKFAFYFRKYPRYVAIVY